MNVTNPERDPAEVRLGPGGGGPALEVLTPREVPLGGLRAMTVRRTLPQRQRTLIGAWCFIDHYGPDLVTDTGGMQVAPHPHTGLQTVSWLFSGEIEHRDSAGHHAPVRPGELNLMTAGRGISHSEVSTPATRLLHGVQLWVALPDPSRDGDAGFEHYAPPRVDGAGWRARVFLGSALGHTSPVTTHTPLLGAEIVIESGGSVTVPVDASFEHGVLVDSGVVTVGDLDAKPSDLVYAAPGPGSLTLTAHDEPVRLLLLGGPPFGEPIVMWWNFVGRTHDEIVAYRAEWQAQVTRDGTVLHNSRDVAPGRFGVVDDPLAPIPAPELPNARLKERR